MTTRTGRTSGQSRPGACASLAGASGRLLRRSVLCLALAAAFVGAFTVSSRACQLCTPFPRASAADYLIAADAVVLAREDPERPFHFATTEVLKGDSKDAVIDLFLDSRTRRVLAEFPERSVVLALIEADCGALLWRRVGLADDEFGPAVRRILAVESTWRSEPVRRWDFFAQWLGHRNTQLCELAHIEVARAPYRTILKYKDAVPREEIHRFLADTRNVQWRPLYILLLSATEHPEDRETIRRSFHSAARFGWTESLDAWTAAFVEIAEAEAIEAVEELYFRRGDRSPEELRAVVKALSVHGTAGHVHLRDSIVASYAELVERHPERAVDLIKDLEAWNRADLGPAIAAIVSDRPSTIDRRGMRQLRDHLLRQMRSSLRPARATELR